MSSDHKKRKIGLAAMSLERGKVCYFIFFICSC